MDTHACSPPFVQYAYCTLCAYMRKFHPPLSSAPICLHLLPACGHCHLLMSQHPLPYFSTSPASLQHALSHRSRCQHSRCSRKTSPRSQAGGTCAAKLRSLAPAALRDTFGPIYLLESSHVWDLLRNSSKRITSVQLLLYNTSMNLSV